ncbi:MAG: type I-E CRISPR-associated protein Cse1/CasA [Dermabacter sp.]|nr:type I-E CRISPR-associated protein Cse1/CasA [Dermabacter sp.]
MTEPPSFSLLSEPWIPCETTDGGSTLLSLREVFDGQHPVVGIRGDSPTQDYAVLRVLLAIFWRAHRHETEVGPGQTFYFEDWMSEQWAKARSTSPDQEVLDYLERYANRFDLLHPETPFMQVAGLHTQSGSTSAISRIVPESEGDYFAMRAGAGITSISLPEAARWVISTQAYDYSGIKSGAVGDPRVKGGRGYPIGTGWTGMTGGTTILGTTLRETLVLNTAPEAVGAGEEDRPVWEREADGPAERPSPHPAGPADLATWQGRRIRLFPDGDRVTRVLVSNGDRIPNAGANIMDDPMTPYRYSTNKSTAALDVYYPRPYDTQRMMWKSLEPLVVQAGDLTYPKGVKPPKPPKTLTSLATIRLSGEVEDLAVFNIRLSSASYGPQASSSATTVDARIDLPRALLHESHPQGRLTVLHAAQATQDAAVALGQFAGNLLVAAGGEYAFQADATNGALSALEAPFRAWLRGIDLESLDAAARQWQEHVDATIRNEGHVLLRGAGPRALIGRETTDQNGRTVVVSAASAWTTLTIRLRKILPLTSTDDTTKSPTESSSSKEDTPHAH